MRHRFSRAHKASPAKLRRRIGDLDCDEQRKQSEQSVEPHGSDGVHHCVTGVTTAYTVTVTDGGTGCVGGNGETVTVLPSTNNSSQNQPPVKAPVK